MAVRKRLSEQMLRLGHRVTLHGCTIGDRVLVGMGAIVLDGATIGSDVVIAAGTLIPPRMNIPSGTMVMGQPGRVIRDLKEAELAWIPKSAEKYVLAAEAHRARSPTELKGSHLERLVESRCRRPH